MFKILNNLRKLPLMLLVMTVLITAPSSAIALNQSKSALSVTSTVAGFDTYYTLLSDKDYTLFLISPEGDRHQIKSKYSKIDSKYLKKAGKYSLLAATKVNTGLFGSKYKVVSQSTFEVMPGKTDPKKSNLKFLTKPILNAEVPVLVTLRDQFGNPVSGNEVSLLADGSSEVSVANSNITNSDGTVLFKYKKLSNDKDKLLAMDKNDDVLLSTIEISKFAAASVYGFGGDLVSIADGDRFEFFEYPAVIEPFEEFDFSLRALDSSQELDDTYSGTIRFFSATDDLAGLPDDYTFDNLDEGEAYFEGETYFTEEGTQTLNVVDVDNEELLGSVEIEVSFGAPERTVDATSNGDLNIISPIAGSTTSSVVNFKGTTDPGLEVSIFDNGEILTAEDADAEGNFDFNSPVLADGTHTFVIEAGSNSSDEIVVTIDTTSDIVSNLQIDPDEVFANDPVSFEVSLTRDASRVSVVIDEKRSDLIKADTVGRAFTGVVNAPSAEGTYNVGLIIVDLDGESISLTNLDTIDVSAGAAGQITFNVPSQVLGLNAQPGDKKVNLNWQAAFDNTGITNYRINYGIDRNLLLSSVNTNGPETNWYVPNLINGTTYYFQVFGIDTEGNLSDQGSAVVSAVPSSAYGGGLHGSADGQVTVNQVTNSGPEVYVLLAFAAFFSYWFRLDKKLV